MAIKLKRSAVAAKVPLVADLELGELAVNTYDGKLYTKADNGTASVVEIGPVQSVAGRTGAVTLAKADVSGLGTGDSPQFAAINLGHASDTTLTRAAAGTVAVEGVNLARTTDIVGQQTIWVPAAAMIARTTNGAAAGVLELATNDLMIAYYAFDSSTSQAVQFAIQMPRGWNEGPIIPQFVWTHPATTTNFGLVWGMRAVAFANDDGLDATFGTAQEVADTGGTTNDCYITAEAPAMTVAGSPGAEEYVVFEAYRAPANAADTMAVNAYLLGVRLHYTTDAAKDD